MGHCGKRIARIALGGGFALGPVFAGLVALTAAAQTSADPPADWPCIQRFVPTMTAAAMWAFPQWLPAEGADWQKSDNAAAVDGIAELAIAVAAQGEAALPAVADFAARAKGTEARGRLLARLFAGVVEELNNRRNRQMRAILKFARSQRELAKKITADQSALAAGDQTRARRLEWSIRLYDERESTLVYLCEQPVQIEQRAFAVGRLLAGLAEEGA